MANQLAGKSVIVTGGGRGYGAHMSRAVAGEGAHVVIASRTLSECEGAARGIVEAGGSAFAVAADVADAAAVGALADAALARFGPVDILINNAASPGSVADVVDLPAADWQRTFDVNVKGTFLCTQAVLPGMIERRSGHIVNLSSGTARLGFRHVRSVDYTTTKHAIEGFSSALAVKLEPHGVRVNAFTPGLAVTRFLDNAPPGYLSGQLCQTVDHVCAPLLHLLSGAVPSGAQFEAVAWLREHGLLERFSYIHE